MCYYARTDYPCGDWKWGNMMERCARQHRIGETCGTKLVHENYVNPVDSQCKICQEIDTKRRRLVKAIDNIRRWSAEADKFSASLEKAHREKVELEDKIRELNLRRPSIRSNSATRPPVLPPMSTIAPSYEYHPSAQISRRQEPHPYGPQPTVTPAHPTMPTRNTNDSYGVSPSPRGIPVAASKYASYPLPYSTTRRP